MNENSTQQNKLDNFVKDSLKEYEVPANMSNWTRMEQMLDATPRSSNVLNNKLILGSIAAGVVIVGTITTFYFSSPTGEKQPNESTSQEEIIPRAPVNPIENIENATATSVEKNIPESAETSLPVKIETEKENIAAVKEEPVKEKPVIATRKISPGEEEKNENPKTGEAPPVSESESGTGTNFVDVFNKLKKDNVATFGDMIDPAKGFTKKTEEEERLQREAMKKVTEEDPFGTPSASPQDSVAPKSSDPFR